MSKLIIYGASDDLVEIGGDFYEEFNPREPEDGFLILCSDGTALKGKYDGVWRFTVHTTGSASISKEEAPEDDDDNYSDRVTLEGDIAWVALGNGQIAKPKSA